MSHSYVTWSDCNAPIEELATIVRSRYDDQLDAYVEHYLGLSTQQVYRLLEAQDGSGSEKWEVATPPGNRSHKRDSFETPVTIIDPPISKEALLKLLAGEPIEAQHRLIQGDARDIEEARRGCDIVTQGRVPPPREAE